MNTRIALLIVAALVGVISGPYSLESAAQGAPSIEWDSLAFAFAGCLAAILVVLGLQAALGNDKALRWGWLFFLVAATYFTGAGIGAVVVSALGPGVVPHSFLFLVMGLASLAGLAVVKRVFASRFTNGI